MKKSYILFGMISMFAGANAQYCSPPSYLSGPFTAITNVTTGGINHDTGTSEGYADYSASQSATMAQGATVPFDFEHYYDPSLVSSFDGAVELRVWIDWNQDMDFDDGGEECVNTQVDYSGSDYTNSSHSISVPLAATLGNTRMRVYEDMLLVDGHALPDPCGYSSGIGQHGECHDYTVNVTAAGAGFAENDLVSNLNIFPNPATSDLTVQFTMSKYESATISLHNLMGSVVLSSSEKVNGTLTKTVDVSSLSQGVYLLNISTSEGTITKKVVVK